MFVNLTDRPILFMTEWETLRIPISSNKARVKLTKYTRSPLRDEAGHDFPVYRAEPGEIIGLPPQHDGKIHVHDGKIYIVNDDVARMTTRNDVVTADLENAVRDANGNVVAITGFIQYH